MKQKLLLVPPDTRPPTLDLPAGLARAAGLDVLTPPAEALPSNINHPGSFESLRTWLLQHIQDTSILICCLETLCLGGMIPARRVSTSTDDTQARLELLSNLKKLNPKLSIYAFGVIVRVPHGNDPYEEKSYFAQYGDALRSYSIHHDRFIRYHLKEDKAKAQKAKHQVPEHNFKDWLGTRQRNHQLHLKALDLVNKKILEHVCLTLDDTTTYGLAALDKRALEAKTDELGLWHKVDIYPGADEVPCTLLARALQTSPSKVYVRYSASTGHKAGMMFEDRPAGELIKAHLRAAHCYQVDTLSEADFVLAVNVPAHKQPYEDAQPDLANVDTSSRHLPEFVDFIQRALTEKPVAVADIAYPNGAELRFLKLLRQSVPLNALAGFAAWNTAGNTLGSVITMAVCAQANLEKSLWTQLLFNRFVDDYLYQSRVRKAVYDNLDSPSVWALGDQLEQAEKEINTRIKPLAEKLWEEQFLKEGFELIWKKAYLAWPRLFTGIFPFEVKAKTQ